MNNFVSLERKRIHKTFGQYLKFIYIILFICNSDNGISGEWGHICIQSHLPWMAHNFVTCNSDKSSPTKTALGNNLLGEMGWFTRKAAIWELSQIKIFRYIYWVQTSFLLFKLNTIAYLFLGAFSGKWSLLMVGKGYIFQVLVSI